MGADHVPPLRIKLHLDTLGQLAGVVPPSLDSISDQSSASALTIHTLDTLARTLAGGGGGGGGGASMGTGTGRDGTTTNLLFNNVLFGEYRRRKVNGKPVRDRDIPLKIANGELPELPHSPSARRTPGTRMRCATPPAHAWPTMSSIQLMNTSHW